MFFEKIHPITMPQQPIWQIICISIDKNNIKRTHIGKLAYYKLVPWLKKFEKVYNSSFICASSIISILIKSNVAVNSISVSHQSSIVKTPFTDFISLRR